MPPPKVDSAVIQLKILEKPPVETKDEEFFFKFVKACFAQRRKTLVNTVSSTLGIDKETLRGALADAMCRQKIMMGPDEYSTKDALRTAKVPVMFVHGTDDHFVPVEMTYENYMACASPKKLLIVPGADHGMSYFMEPRKYEAEVLDFFKQT